MKKKELFITISTLTLILIFGAAISCNFCSTPEGKEIAQGLGQLEEGITNFASNNDSNYNKNIDESGGEGEEDFLEGEDSPTVKLKIYEGPTYSAENDICFYRIEALVGGNPMPETVEFSKDDSGGSWGSFKAQVNLTREEPTYILTATVNTSEGSDTDSIELSWGCNGREAAEDDGGEQQQGEQISNNPPKILEIDGMPVEDVESAEPYSNICVSDGSPNYGFPIEFTAIDEDGDELTYSVSDSKGNNFDVTKIDNNTAEFYWSVPLEAGSYALNMEVSDGRGGKDLYSMDFILKPRQSHPPAIDGINIVEIATGKVIQVGEVTQGIRGGYEYRIEIDVWDMDGDLVNDYSLETTGLIREDTDSGDIWTAIIWTPPEPGDAIIFKKNFTVTVRDEAGNETKKSTEVWITN